MHHASFFVFFLPTQFAFWKKEKLYSKLELSVLRYLINITLL